MNTSKIGYVFLLSVLFLTNVQGSKIEKSRVNSCLEKSTVGQKDSRLDGLSDKAEAIAAIKILSTDYTDTASDGPMYAKAKVLKVLKGNVSTWRKLHFGETGWWSPTYKKGQYRIVFLARKKLKDEYFKAKWRTIYTGGVGFFFTKDSLKDISQKSLLDFLKRTKQISDGAPKIEFGITRKDQITRTLSVKIINDEEQAFWLNPSRATVSFEANRARYYREIDWTDYEKDLWKKIEPASSIAGSIDIKDEEIGQEQEIKLMLSHSSVCFPHPCWIGVESVIVSTPTNGQQNKYHESLMPPALFEWTSSKDGSLSVCFTVNKTTFESNEALSVRCAVRNNTDKPLTILRPFGDEFYSLSSGLYILGPGGQITYHGPWKEYVLSVDSFSELSPHSVIDEVLEIPSNLFPGINSPGLYKIAYTYQSGNYPRKTKPANHWEGKVISDLVILLRQPSEAPNALSGGEEVKLTCSMIRDEFDIGEKLPPPKVTINNNSSDPGEIHADANSLVDYVSLYNKQSHPENYEPEQNAAEHYQKAIELFIEAPEEIRRKDMPKWPTDLSNGKVQILKQWVKQNEPALTHLIAGTKKSYRWTERTSPNGSILGILMPELAKMRNLMYLLCYKAKLAAIDGKFKEATEDVVTVYQMGKHYTGPGTLVEQMVGAGIKSYAIETALLIMQEARPAKKNRERLLHSLQQYIKEEKFKPDLMILRFICLDSLQRMYVVNKDGQKILDETEARRQLAMLNLHAHSLIMLGGTFVGEHYKSELTGISYQHAEELLLTGLEELEEVIALDAWQLNKMINDKNSILQKIQKSHLLLNTLALTAVNMKISAHEQLRTQICGLNMTMAVLEFQENTGHLPSDLKELQNTGLLHKIPVDPFSSELMKYKRLDGNFTVYSYGLDFDDDGGSKAFGDFMFGGQNGDLVIWPVKRSKGAAKLPIMR